MWPTPLVKLKRLSTKRKRLYAKLEFFNPFSRSIKDRTVWYMIEKNKENLKKSKKIVEVSSGNTAIALAIFSVLLRKSLKIYLPKKVPKTTKIILSLLNVELREEEVESTSELLKKVLHRRIDGFMLNQFYNEANPEVHYKFTAREIDEQLKILHEKPSVIVAAIGTAGHIAGISKYFKEKYDVKVVGVQPTPNSFIPGMKRIENKQPFLNYSKIDKIIEVSFEEAIKGVIEVAKKEGLLVGLSSGAVLSATKKVNYEGVYVLIFPDDIFKYIGLISSFHKQN